MAETASNARDMEQKHPKKGGALDKYKWWLIGGLAGVAALVFFFTNRSNANAAASQQQQGYQPGNAAIDPSTGIPYAAEYGMYGGGGFGGGSTGATGPAGPAGPAGKTGPRGPAGKPRVTHKHHPPKHHPPKHRRVSKPRR